MYMRRAIQELGQERPPAPTIAFSTITAISVIMQLAIIALGAITFAFLGCWAFLRLRKRLRRGSPVELEVMILESEISIDFGADIELGYGGKLTGSRASFETIVSPVSPGRMAFDIDKLPMFQIQPRSGGILERRGKKTLILKPSQNLDSDVDMVFVDINDGRLTVSPFASKKVGSHIMLGSPTRLRTAPLASTGDSTPVPTALHRPQESWRPIEMFSPFGPATSKSLVD